MQSFILFPDLPTALFEIELFGRTFALRFYALAYIFGFLIAVWIMKRLMRTPVLWPNGRAPMQPEAVDDFLTFALIAVILGGRLGYVLFYQPGRFASDPMAFFRIWEGGMAFHGGMIGVVIGVALFARLRRISVLSLADATALATPPGLFLGRIANFINAELWGRPTTLPWGVLFPGERAQTCPSWWDGICARHPSQLYQAALEGIALMLVLLVCLRTGYLRSPGRIAGVFIAGYGVVRFTVEYFRQPDPQFASPDNPIGFAITFGDIGFTMGQMLSLPMIALGLGFIFWSNRARVA